jgi:hypothetical protein
MTNGLLTGLPLKQNGDEFQRYTTASSQCAASPAHPLEMPADCMYGHLGELAVTLQVPLGWAYLSLVTLYAGRGINLFKDGEYPRPSLYTVLLGPAGSGKGVTTDRARKALGIPLDDWHYQEANPVSDRGLIMQFRAGLEKGQQPPPPQGVTIVADEWGSTMSKMGIKGSTLAHGLCTLWSRSNLSVSDKTGTVGMREQISILGNLKASDPSEFARAFGIETSAGLCDRFVIVPGVAGWRFDRKWSPKLRECSSPGTESTGNENTIWQQKPTCVDLTGEAIDAADAWENAHLEQGVPPGRLVEIALRVAVITASANRETSVSSECIQAALRLADWQLKVRSVYAAGIAENPGAIVVGAILDRFEELESGLKLGSPKKLADRDIISNDRFVTWHVMVKAHNLSRKFGPELTRSRDSLVNEGTLEAEFEQKKDGGKRTGRYRLVRV